PRGRPLPRLVPRARGHGGIRERDRADRGRSAFDVRDGHRSGGRGSPGGDGRSRLSTVAVARGPGSRLRRRPAGDAEGRIQTTRGTRGHVMGRPGFVLEVDERTPPLLVHQGEGFGVQKFPLGSRVIYPPDSLPGIKDVTGAIRHALLNPIGCEPLPELLKPGMRLTIAFDDISLPLP